MVGRIVILKIGLFYRYLLMGVVGMLSLLEIFEYIKVLIGFVKGEKKGFFRVLVDFLGGIVFRILCCR